MKIQHRVGSLFGSVGIKVHRVTRQTILIHQLTIHDGSSTTKGIFNRYPNGEYSKVSQKSVCTYTLFMYDDGYGGREEGTSTADSRINWFFVTLLLKERGVVGSMTGRASTWPSKTEDRTTPPTHRPRRRIKSRDKWPRVKENRRQSYVYQNYFDGRTFMFVDSTGVWGGRWRGRETEENVVLRSFLYKYTWRRWWGEREPGRYQSKTGAVTRLWREEFQSTHTPNPPLLSSKFCDDMDLTSNDPGS